MLPTRCTKMRALLLLSLLTSQRTQLLNGQASINTVVQPDCILSFTFTVGPAGRLINNISSQCTNWVVSYSSTGFSALSMTFQYASEDDKEAAMYTLFPPDTGSNPMTSTTSATSTYVGFHPWVRLIWTAGTGSGKISGVIYGYKNQAQ